jgi:hypothetical protein
MAIIVKKNASENAENKLHVIVSTDAKDLKNFSQAICAHETSQDSIHHVFHLISKQKSWQQMQQPTEAMKGYG